MSDFEWLEARYKFIDFEKNGRGKKKERKKEGAKNVSMLNETYYKTIGRNGRHFFSNFEAYPSRHRIFRIELAT